MTPAHIRACRAALGLSQTALAYALRVRRRTVYAWERGEHGISEAAADRLRRLIQDRADALSELAAPPFSPAEMDRLSHTISNIAAVIQALDSASAPAEPPVDPDTPPHPPQPSR